MTFRVLFTGASSFTGSWFATALAAAGAEVVAPCRGGAPDAGDAGRRERLAHAAAGGRCRLVPDAPFGGPAFLDLVRDAGPFDLLCHHGAKAGDHRDPGLDPFAAAAGPCHRLEAVLDALQAGGCRAVLLTGTVFEADEGKGSPPLRGIGPYGLAKTLTWQVFRHHAQARGLPLAEFVVANPVGPLEKPGLSRGLAEAWLAGRTPVLHQPHLTRDQLQVEGLAMAYAAFAVGLAADPGDRRLVPSQYPERLDRFAARLAAAMAPRLRVPCRFAVAEPPEPAPDEPLQRVGLTPLAALCPASTRRPLGTGTRRGCSAETDGQPFDPAILRIEIYLWLSKVRQRKPGP